jgi:hypothetical protein
MSKIKIIIFFLIVVYIFLNGTSNDKRLHSRHYGDGDTTISYLRPHQILKFVKDSVENSIKRKQCPNILYDPCMDYQRQFRSYLQYTINPKTKQRAIIPCSHCVKYSLKQDLIDSLSIDHVKAICELCDTIKLNQKCHDSIHLGGMPRLNYKQSTYDLILTRLKNK